MGKWRERERRESKGDKSWKQKGGGRKGKGDIIIITGGRKVGGEAETRKEEGRSERETGKKNKRKVKRKTGRRRRGGKRKKIGVEMGNL